MKFLRKDGGNLVFQLSKRDKTLLINLCKLYPLVPGAHHRISSSPDLPALQANQHLLEEALAEHRAEVKKELEAMLNARERFRENALGWQLTLAPQDAEWLLQVLNDIRVGSWLQLGSPDQNAGHRIVLNEYNARYLWAMELSGHLQALILSARDAGEVI